MFRREVGLSKITLLRTFLCFLLVCNIATSYGQNKFTGTYIADSKPREVVYLGLTQTGNIVSGSLVIVTPDRHGSTKGNTWPLQGATDGDAITLTAERFLQDLVINGRKQGKSVVLMFPTDSGNMSTVTFLPITDRDYNLLLSRWQKELAAIYEEKKSLTNLANALADDINAVKSTGIKRNLADLKSALEDEQSALKNLENNLAELQQDASLRPMTCYQAYSKIDYDYNSRMMHTYSSRLGYAHDNFMLSLKELEHRLSNVEPIVTKIRQETHILHQAIKESKYPPPKLNARPGDETQVLVEYQSLAVSAHNELPFLKDTHSDILNKAKEIMREGEAILTRIQASVRCD